MPKTSFTSTDRPLHLNESGVSMLEASLIIGVVITVILLFIDCGRYFAAQSILLKSAQTAADYASKIADFDTDIVTLGSSAEDTAKYQKFVAARQAVTDEATQLALTTFFSAPNSSSSLNLETMNTFDQKGGVFTAAQPGNTLILRPGECGKRLDGSQICHPQRCPAENAIPPAVPQFQCSGIPRRGASETMASLLQQLPIMVVSRGRLLGLTPFLRNVPIEVVAMSWREVPIVPGFKEGVLSPSATPEPPPPLSSGDGQGESCVNQSGCGNLCYNGCNCVSCGGS